MKNRKIEKWKRMKEYWYDKQKKKKRERENERVLGR